MIKIAVIFFSMFYWFGVFVWLGVVFLMTSFFLMFFSYPKIHSWIPAIGFKTCILMGLHRLNVRYDPKFNRQRRSVFCQNHVNLLDGFIASAVIPHAFCGVMHAWQFKIPIYGWFMKLSRGIEVDPNKRNNRQTITLEAKIRKEENMSILVFPEGGRTTDGQVKRFKKGVFLMARDAGFPIVPIAVKGSFAINQKGSWLFKPFQTIEVFVGEAVETFGKSDREMEEIAQAMQKYISSFVGTS